MKRSIVGVSVLGLALLAGACGPKEAGTAKLKKLDKGITRDSMLAILGTGPLSASGADTARLVSGYRQSRFLTNGVLYEVIYVRDTTGDVREELSRARETPIVLVNDTVQYWGWKKFKAAAETTLFPLPSDLSK